MRKLPLGKSPGVLEDLRARVVCFGDHGFALRHDLLDARVVRGHFLLEERVLSKQLLDAAARDSCIVEHLMCHGEVINVVISLLMVVVLPRQCLPSLALTVDRCRGRHSAAPSPSRRASYAPPQACCRAIARRMPRRKCRIDTK